MRRALVLAAVAAGALAASAPAQAVRYAVGLDRRADVDAVATAVERRTGSRPERLAPIPALVVDAPSRAALARIPGVRYVEPIVERRLAMTPTDPLVSKQWYLTQSRFYEPWLTLPALEPVPVAVIDSGVDVSHPELAGRILTAKSFVGGPPGTDALGHGTFVAGLIAAGVGNGIGIAGLAPSAELLVAKVVTKSRTISIEAEAKAIRWAVENGARVVNLSLGGIRDPLDPNGDSFSRLEADAVAYAVSNGAVVVAAVGNGDGAPETPWRYASFPAALPHVLGVSALGQDGGVPKFSNRDPVYNDIAAPGLQILSILPRPLTQRFPACSEQGYSSCGPEEYREAQGTSFATPQVSAAAAVLLSLRPSLRPEQVRAILRSSALDSTPANGCAGCSVGRDSLSGWGRLDVAAAIAALAGPLPLRDRYESNDDAGSRSYELFGVTRRIDATVDFWDDQDDVYAISLKKGQPVYVGLKGPEKGYDLNMALWLPHTRSIEDVASVRMRVRLSARPGARQYFAYRAPEAGKYFVQVRMSSAGLARYRLTVVKA